MDTALTQSATTARTFGRDRRTPRPAAIHEVDGGSFHPHTPHATVRGAYAPQIRVLVRTEGGRLVGVIELVSEANKDSAAHADEFAGRIESLLAGGVSVVVVDLVTRPRHNVHNRWTDRFPRDGGVRFEDAGAPWVSAYRARPTPGSGDGEIDVWLWKLSIGDSLPTVPLFLEGEDVVAIPLDGSYEEACLDAGLVGVSLAT
jgi:hypothetical protein